MKPIQLFFLVFLAFTISCQEKTEISDPVQNDLPANQISSPLTCDVVIKPNPDDPWAVECLKDLKREEFVDAIFNGVYNKQITAYDIFEGKKLSVGAIKKMEENGEIDRDKIGKFQFVEEWYFDKESLTMTKKVKEIRLGAEAFDDEGYLRGYQPIFNVVLN